MKATEEEFIRDKYPKEDIGGILEDVISLMEEYAQSQLPKEEIYSSMKEFVMRAFPDATPHHHALKLKEEAEELIESPTDPNELADCLLCLFGVCAKAGFTYSDLMTFAKNKLEVIEKRTWVKQDNGTYHHKFELPKEGEEVYRIVEKDNARYIYLKDYDVRIATFSKGVSRAEAENIIKRSQSHSNPIKRKGMKVKKWHVVDIFYNDYEAEEAQKKIDMYKKMGYEFHGEEEANPYDNCAQLIKFIN